METFSCDGGFNVKDNKCKDFIKRVCYVPAPQNNP